MLAWVEECSLWNKEVINNILGISVGRGKSRAVPKVRGPGSAMSLSYSPQPPHPLLGAAGHTPSPRGCRWSGPLVEETGICTTRSDLRLL